VQSPFSYATLDMPSAGGLTAAEGINDSGTVGGHRYLTSRDKAISPLRRRMIEDMTATMIRRRARSVGIKTRVDNHTFRAAGITAYLKNGDTLENAAACPQGPPRFGDSSAAGCKMYARGSFCLMDSPASDGTVVSAQPSMRRLRAGLGREIPLASLPSTDEPIEPSLVMFSGGRDSTLAALRLHQEGMPIALVTITSNHLVGKEYSAA
jgi:hypothetical protein